MVRQKITTYVPPDLADALKRVAAIKDRSVSDIVEDAIARTLSRAGRDVEQAALMAKLEAIQRRLGGIERSQEVLFELSAHAARFAMSVAPDITDGERAHANARGAERLRGVLGAIVQRLGAGKSMWKEHFPPSAPEESTSGGANDTRQNGRAAADAEAMVP